MNIFQRIAAAVGGIGVLALAIWLGTIIFVILLIVAPIAAIYLRWKMGKVRKEFEKAQGNARRGPDGVIEADYVIVEEVTPLDETIKPRQ